MGNICQNSILSAILILFLSSLISAQEKYPDWSYEMKIWPFDVLYPFETAFARINGEDKTSDTQIRNNLNTAKNEGANVVIFYIDEEQTYETFVDESGFNQTLSRIKFLVEEAHTRNLKVVCYLNGLEVISVGATTNQTMPSLARNNPDWLQVDITGDKMVWYTTSQIDWIPGNSEDAWASPLSPWRDLLKSRLSALGTTGLDGVYIDATFLPGVDNFGIKWASSDPYFQDEFQDSYGLSIPSNVDWNSEQWRKFIYFRHQVIRDYLGELADVARTNGITPFFESSSCDFKSGTFLGNDVPFTISGGIACSPEIEPEGDYFAAFRMSKATRDANQDFPMWFLGWPESPDLARREYAITLCHSGNYYPTADAGFPSNSFTFMDLLREPVLNKRVPFQNTVLIYPMRSKDYTYTGGSTFDSYENAFTKLMQKHIPFRILPMETMTSSDLININNVVLAGAESISDAEYDLLKNKIISLVGENGTKDEWGNERSQPLVFSNVTDISNLTPGFVFTVQAPTTSYLEYYVDESDEDHYFIFTYNDNNSGQIIINNSTSMTGKVYEIDNGSHNINGTIITVPIVDYLEIIELQLNSATAVNNNDSPDLEFMSLENIPNPFNSSTTIKFVLKERVFTEIKVYDILGTEIVSLLNEELNAGDYEVVFNANQLSSGVYIYRIIAGKFTASKKMNLVK
ncbi:MAG: T9SS type A sorting domain-containing protein [Melioribacteraceae bacterium]|nr:T9SS type A sorting domain-containing protein [Melioribacteraceae bacterium]